MAAEVTPAASPFSVRIAKPEDMALVYSDWLRSTHQHTSDGQSMRRAAFFAYYHGVIERLVERLGTVVMVACDRDDDDRLYGWLCVSLDLVPRGIHVVHYGHVKSLYRRRGVFRALCDSVGLDERSQVAYTVSTRRTRKLAAKAASAEFTTIERFLGSKG